MEKYQNQPVRNVNQNNRAVRGKSQNNYGFRKPYQGHRFGQQPRIKQTRQGWSNGYRNYGKQSFQKMDKGKQASTQKQ